MKKALLIVLVVIVLVVITVPLWVDSAARTAVESGGTKALGVKTSLDSISLKIFGGACSLEGLEIANPEGFGDSPFLALGSGSVAVDLGSVMGDEVVIPTVTLTGIDMTLERTLKGSNYGVILDNLKKREKGGAGEQEGKKFVIEELVIKDVHVVAKFSLGVAKAPIPLQLDEIRMTNVGSGGDGVSMARLFDYVVRGLLRGVLKAGKGVLPDSMLEGLGDGLGSLGGLGIEGLKIMGEGGGEILEGVGEGLTEGIGGLLGGKKKKKKEEDK